MLNYEKEVKKMTDKDLLYDYQLAEKQTKIGEKNTALIILKKEILKRMKK